MKRVLIIEDDPAFSEILRTRINNRYDTQITVVFDGQDALEAIKKDAFDLILLDVLLPGIDGYTLAMRIRDAALSEIPILVITGIEDNFIKDKFNAISAVKDYLIKPLKGEDLFNKLDPFLH